MQQAKGECAESDDERQRRPLLVHADRFDLHVNGARRVQRNGGPGQPCYRYVFNEPSYPYDKPNLHLAVHGSNTPFAFGNLQAYYESCAGAGCGRASPEQLSVQQAMERYYIGFITSGDPNAVTATGPAGVELPQWPAAGTPDAQTQQYMSCRSPVSALRRLPR